ncbi:MAG: SemiSWEET transporter [Alphaproteobacteria bacterium]|nr:SemiSWEET transporter [Alphaproteobacteria bacterium]
MAPITLLGLFAGILTTVAFIPQALQVWRTRSTSDISLGMFSMMSCGILLWLIYGFLQNDVPLIAANTVTLGLALSILIAKLRFK